MEGQNDNSSSNNDSGNLSLSNCEGLNNDDCASNASQLQVAVSMGPGNQQYSNANNSELSRQQSLKRESQFQADDVFHSKKKLEERNSVFALNDYEKCSSENRHLLIQGEEQVKNNGTPRDTIQNFIPIDSCDYRKNFSHMMKEDGSNMGCLSQTQSRSANDNRAQKINTKPNDQFREETKECHRFAKSVPTKASDNASNSKQLPVDFLCQVLSADKGSESNNTVFQAPELIPKVIFDKLVREVVKLKKENGMLREQNVELHHRNMELSQQMQHNQNKMYEMSVELPPVKDPIKETGFDERGAQKFEIDIQQSKTTEILADGGNPMGGTIAEYNDDGGFHHHHRRNVEMDLRMEIQKLKQTIQEMKKQNGIIVNKYNEEKKMLVAVVDSLKIKLKTAESNEKELEDKNKNLQDMIEDERLRFERDVKKLGQKIESQKAKLKNQDSGSSASDMRSSYNKRK